MNERELKLEFARQMLRHNGDAFKAAFAACGEDNGFALQVARLWPLDPFVVAEQTKLIEGNDGKAFLPTKEYQARDVYRMATDEKIAPEDRLKAHRLYAEIMGNIEKPVAGGINIMAQGVMIVPMAQSDEHWEEKAVQQQRALTAHATIVQ